jgi:hypothetical protein
MRILDEGITAVEVILVLFITFVLALGVTHTFASSVSSVQKNQKISVTGSGTANVNSSFSSDVEESNGFLVPSASNNDSVTGASGDGAIVTYTYGGSNSLVVGQFISITGMVPAGYNLSNSVILTAPTATTFTVANSTTGAVTTSGSLFTQCSTWDRVTDTSFTNVRPLVSLSKQASAPITSVSGSGTTATYTFTGPVQFAPGQTVTVSGLLPAGYNLIGAKVLTVDPSAKTFTLSNTTTGAMTNVGILIYNNLVGYEVRKNGTSAELWRIQCPFPQKAFSSATSELLRSGLPLPSSTADWANSMMCSSFTSGALVSSSCPANKFLNSATSNPGLILTLPATLFGATTPYTSQVVLAARSIS